MDASSNLSARQQPARREHGRVHEDAETMDEDPFFPEAPQKELVIPKKVRSFMAKRKKPVIITVIVAVVVIAAAVIVGRMVSGIPGVDSSRYQAVFLTDGTVYMGKLSVIDGAHYKLAKVYYFTSNQVSTTADKSAQDVTANTSLIRLDNGALGADDEMTIQRDKVLLYENLKTDGAVAKLIANDQK
jgi:hypothetical protein